MRHKTLSCWPCLGGALTLTSRRLHEGIRNRCTDESVYDVVGVRISSDYLPAPVDASCERITGSRECYGKEPSGLKGETAEGGPDLIPPHNRPIVVDAQSSV